MHAHTRKLPDRTAPWQGAAERGARSGEGDRYE